MNVSKLFFLLLTPVFFTNTFAADSTVTLQNGLNGYTGCEDAWIGKGWTQNTSNDDTLVMEFEDGTD